MALLDFSQGGVPERVARSVDPAEVRIELRHVGHRAAALRPYRHGPAVFLAGRDDAWRDGSGDRVAEDDDTVLRGLVRKGAGVPGGHRDLGEADVAAQLL